MYPRRDPAERASVQGRKDSQKGRTSPGTAERSVRRLLLGAALILLTFSLIAFLTPLLFPLPPRVTGAVSWRPTAVGAAVTLGLLLRELRGAGIMLGLGLCLIELPALLGRPPVAAGLATFGQTLLIGLVLGFAGTVMLRLARAADVAARGRERAVAAAAAAAGAGAARARAAALVHDEVLSTLSLAASPQPVDRQRLAAQAARVRGLLEDASTDEQHASLGEALREDAWALDPDTAFALYGAQPPLDLPSAIPPVIRSAVRQALHNSLLHAGSKARRRLSVEHGPAAFRATVTDDGAGFDPAQVPARRLGLRTAARTLRAVGGALSVHSGAGRGTVVSVEWPAEFEDASGKSAREPASSTSHVETPRIGDVPLVRLGATVVTAALAATQTALALLAVPGAEPRWTPLLTLALLLTAAMLLHGSHDRLDAGRTALVLGLSGCALAVGLLGAPFEVGELWFAGAAAFLLAALSFRGRPLAAAAGAILLSALLVASGILALAPPFLILSLSVRPLGVALFAVGLTLAISALLRRLARELARTEAESARESWERGARAELAERASEVHGLAGGMLAEIARGRPLSRAARARAGALEGRLRDRVRAGRLAVEPLLSAVMRARERGVDVLLLDDREEELPEGFSWEPTAARLVTACEGAASTVIVRLLPAGRSNVLSLVVDGSPVVLPENH